MGDKADSSLKKARKIVGKVIKDMGIDPDDNIVEAVTGGYSWQIARGSADVLISLVPGVNNAAGRIRVVSPIVKMDSGLNLELAVKLLTLNGAELPGVSFGLISGDVVALIGERTVVQLDKEEVQEMLGLIGYYADKYDDLLVKEFGGTRVCDLG
jgi:hypothetical protein